MQQPYRFRYRKDREYRLHSAATGLIHHQVLDRAILDWLSGFTQVWSSLLYVLAGQYEHAGSLGELVMRADRASVAQELGGDPARAMAVSKHALQRQLVDGLRYLLKEELKLNQPQASDGWLTDDDLWLVSKTVSDKLRAHLLSQGFEGIPASNSSVFTVLQDHGLLRPTPEDRAIWKATVTSDAGWSHTFTLLRLSPAVIWESGERPPSFSGAVTVFSEAGETAETDATPTDVQHISTIDIQPPEPVAGVASPTSASAPSPSAVDALLELIDLPETGEEGEGTSDDHPDAEPAGIGEPAEPDALYLDHVDAGTSAITPSAEHFMEWLRHRIESRTIVINDAKARIHTVADTVLLVSPGLFKRYAQEHPQTAGVAKSEKLQDWLWLQKRFEKLQLHRKQPNGLNIWTCEVTGPRKSRRLHGYLLKDPRHLFDEVPPNNPYLSLL